MNRGVRCTSMPGVSLSTRNSVGAPVGPAAASRIMKSAWSPTVTNHFSPLMSQPPSTGVAVVDRFCGSEPASGSVTA